MKKFVIGDIHGHNTELVKVLTASNFNKDTDTLICLGDVCDRGIEVLESIKTLSEIKNLIFILGNHDLWTMEYINGEISIQDEAFWLKQGGNMTKYSIANDKPFVLEFLKKAKQYHIDNHRLFIHAGILPNSKVEDNDPNMLLWDRNMVLAAKLAGTLEDNVIVYYDELFCGHTITQIYDSSVPLHLSNVWMMDTGVAYGGKLSIMDIDTKQIWQE